MMPLDSADGPPRPRLIPGPRTGTPASSPRPWPPPNGRAPAGPAGAASSHRDASYSRAARVADDSITEPIERRRRSAADRRPAAGARRSARRCRADSGAAESRLGPPLARVVRPAGRRRRSTIAPPVSRPSMAAPAVEPAPPARPRVERQGPRSRTMASAAASLGRPVLRWLPRLVGRRAARGGRHGGTSVLCRRGGSG